MLNDTKVLLGISDNTKDGLLTVLIKQAIQTVENYTHTTVTSAMDNIIIQIVVYRFNLLGSEGVSSESYSGVNLNYSTELPQTILSQLNSFRRVRTL